MYLKDKPDKYGLKIVTLNVVETTYLVNIHLCFDKFSLFTLHTVFYMNIIYFQIYGVPYLGKGFVVIGDEKIHEYFFRVTTTPIHGTHRTVTCDNWFMSVPLVQRMLLELYKLTLTCIMRKNKREIPAEMKVASKEPPASKFCHAQDLTLLSYTPKKNKIALLLSSYMHSTEVTNSKPNIIHHYNETKGGTDTFDQLCHSYMVTRRIIFYGMLDQAMVNARIFLKCKVNASNSYERPLRFPVLKNFVHTS